MQQHKPNFCSFKQTGKYNQNKLLVFPKGPLCCETERCLALIGGSRDCVNIRGPKKKKLWRLNIYLWQKNTLNLLWQHVLESNKYTSKNSYLNAVHSNTLIIILAADKMIDLFFVLKMPYDFL